MAHKCNTADRPWTSEVGAGTPDGKITINAELGDGRFDGKHEKTGKPLHGRCFQAGGGLPDRIWFAVPDNNHLYVGVFHSDRRIVGVRFTLGNLLDFVRTRDLDALGGDEDWTGTKT